MNAARSPLRGLRRGRPHLLLLPAPPLLLPLLALLLLVVLDLPAPATPATCPLTIVTALFRLHAKHDPAELRSWTEAFFCLPTCMVVFTDSASAAFVRDLRRGHEARTSVHELNLLDPARSPIHRLLANGSTRFWERQFHLDPENNGLTNPLVYLVWLNKIPWLHEVCVHFPRLTRGYPKTAQI